MLHGILSTAKETPTLSAVLNELAFIKLTPDILLILYLEQCIKQSELYDKQIRNLEIA